MDRGRPLAALLRVFALTVMACAGARASAPLPIREANWLVASQRLHLLTTRPEECLPEDSPELADIPGPSSLVWDPADDTPDWARRSVPVYLNFRKASIYGGSNEVQRGVIATGILGLKG